MTDSVVISGIGVISPLGSTLGQIAARFCAGQRALRPLSDMGVDSAFGAPLDEIPVDVIPADKRSRIGRLDRLCRLFLSAAYAAVGAAQLSIDDADADRVALSFGTGLGCLLTNAEYNQKLVEHGPTAASPRLFAYTVSSAAAGEVSIALGIKGANVTSHAG
ncbi:MAG TPA: beta-ketoacyl synthase N-terminal-like domain-containing protein, partial [Candidatus Margulisiibacteriota bacterium]|nr:beta-ketoacyl synthase N-terminal-like domain-containing protein [Candidatus Margulisiibacteriota bacterium]